MATISTTIQLVDAFSPTLKTINASFNEFADNLSATQRALSKQIDTSSYTRVNNELGRVNSNAINAANGQDKFNRSMQNGSNGASVLWGKLKGLIGVYAGFQTVKGLIGLSDQLVNINARIGLMNDGLQTTDELQRMILESANRSYKPFKETADMVGKLGILAKDAFNNSQDVVNFAEQLNKHFVISGTSAEGISAAMLQMTQAMASGALRGEEFNSIMEQAPTAIKAIADYLKVSTGELKEMASKGQVTAKVIKDAIYAAADDTNKKFNEMPNNFSDIWTVFVNEATWAYREVSKSLTQISDSAGFKKFAQSAGKAVSHLADGAVKAINFIVATFNKISEAWTLVSGYLDSVWDKFKTRALNAINPIIEKFKGLTSSGTFNSFFTLVSLAIGAIANAAGFALETISSIIQFIGNNWDFVAPILWGVAGALAFQGLMALWAKAQIIGAAIAMAWKTVCDWAETAAIIALIWAQNGLNAALAACPITWIIGAIIVLIVLFYLAVAAVNKFCGTSISATGLIFGAFAWLGAMIYNLFVALWNGVLQLFDAFVNIFIGIVEWVLNASIGAFDSFGGAVANLIGQICDWFLGLGKIVTTIIDAIFGTDWTSGLNALSDKVLAWGKKDQKKSITIERNQVTKKWGLERTSATDWATKGYNAGANLSDGFSLEKLSKTFDATKFMGEQTSLNNALNYLNNDDLSTAFNGGNTPSASSKATGADLAKNANDKSKRGTGYGSALDAINKNTAQTAKNTANNSDPWDEDIKYMQLIGERDNVNRYTTAEIKLNVSNNNTINKSQDLDGIVSQLTDKLVEAMRISAEGV